MKIIRLYSDGARKGEGTIHEEKLIEKALKGDEHAYRMLVELYQDHVFRTIFSVLRNERDAKEHAEDVFVHVYYRLPQYEKKGFKTWLTRIAFNYAIDQKRKKTREKEENLDGQLNEKVSPDSVEEFVLKNELQELVHKRLLEVPQNYRDVLVAFYLDEKSYQEIAKEQNVEVKTVEMKLYRARNWLRKNWNEEEFR